MADGQLQLPGNRTITTNVPGNFELIPFEGFATLNTKPQRSAIKDAEMYYCNNFMPVGDNNLRTLWAEGSAVYTAPTNVTIKSFAFANTSTTNYGIVTLGNGAIMAVNTTSMFSAELAGSGVITNFSNNPAISQWGNQFVLVAADQENGYFIWNGQSLFRAGTIGPSPVIANAGLGYTILPTIRPVGGTGTTTPTFNTSLENNSLLSLTVASPGSGYSSGDVVYLAFSSGGISQFSAIAFAQLSGDRVGSISLASGTGGLGYSPATVDVELMGGGGFGATATVQMGASGGAVTAFSMTNLGQGYLRPPTVVISDVFNPVAQATANTMPFGVKGQALETFQSRVWVVDGPTVQFSSPGFPDNFDVRDGAGAFQSTDSFLRTRFTQIKQTNGFLYLIGDSSVNYISSVSTTGNPPITVFNNQNVDPQIGTQWRDAVQVFSRSIVFGNSFGIHSLNGGAIRKVSPQLDGIYSTVPLADFPIVPSSANAVLYGINVYMMLLPIIDPLDGTQRNALMMWDGNRWWTANQIRNMRYIASQEVDSVLGAFFTDGSSIYPMFQRPSFNLTKAVQSKWFSTPTYIMVKEIQRVSGLLRSLEGFNAVFDIYVDTETGSAYAQARDQGIAIWTTASGNPAAWTTASGNAVMWLTPKTGLFTQPVTIRGALVGITAYTQTPDCILVSMSMTARQYNLTI